MRIILVVLATLATAAPALAEHEGATADKVKFRAAGQLELGGTLLNNAAGNHNLKVTGGIRGTIRPSYMLTLSLGYGLAYVREGPEDVTYLNLFHKVYGRADLGFGTVTRQFYFGAGPGVFLNQFSVTDGDTTEAGILLGPGVVYGMGFRMVLGDGPIFVPWAIEFGGQYHHERNDFLVTLLVGITFF